MWGRHPLRSGPPRDLLIRRCTFARRARRGHHAVVDPRQPSDASDLSRGEEIEGAAAILRRGGLVAFPTETVYGLGGDASQPDAVQRIFTAKGRPSTHPLIVHLGSVDQLDEWALDVPAPARVLADAFWPGPLTLLLAKSSTGGR